MESVIERLKLAGLSDDEVMFYYRIQRTSRLVMTLPELRNGEHDDFLRDLQRIQERILARPGLRALGHNSSIADDAGSVVNE